DELAAEDADRRVHAEALVERGPRLERPGPLGGSVGRPEPSAVVEVRPVARAREVEHPPGIDADADADPFRRADPGRAGRGAVREEEPRPLRVDLRKEEQPVVEDDLFDRAGA